jgi:hypothetical protein
MKYKYINGDWRDSDGNPMEVPSGPIAMPMIQSDYPAYYSHGTGKMIEGRTARRDDLKRSGCREVDPSEGPKTCTSEKWARKLGLEHDPTGGRPKHWDKDFSSTRIENP